MSDANNAPREQAQHYFGGQAVIEGVLIRSRRAIALAVRRPNGEIARLTLTPPAWAETRLRRVIGARGVIILLESLITGMRALNLSALIASEEEKGAAPTSAAASANPNADPSAPTEPPAATKGEKFFMGFSLIVGVLFGIALFFVVPSLAVAWIGTENGLWLVANLLEGLIRVAIFLLYIVGVGFLKDIKRLYGYHGAEHKTIHAAERGEELSVGAIRRYPKEHPRCGTSFLITVVLVTVIVFAFLPREPLWLLFLTRLAALPLIMGVSYEIIRWASLRAGGRLAAAINWPNKMAQKLTTREPEDGMIEVAMAAMRMAQAAQFESDSSQQASPSGAAASATDL